MNKINSIQAIINEIQKCIDNDATMGALFLALTIPDICGKVLYSELTGNKNSSKRYIKWFDRYIGDYEQSPLAKEDPVWSEMPYMNGKICYKLRCALLHAGNDDLGKEIGIDEFALAFGKNAILGSSGIQQEIKHMSDGTERIGPKVKSLEVNVVELCNKLMWSAEAFLKKEVKDQKTLPTINVHEIPEIFKVKK